MKRILTAVFAASAAIACGTAAYADSISSVEGARARERAGFRLTGQDRDNLRKYGSNDDWGYGGYRDRGYGYNGGYGGPGVAIYVGPPRYYGGYGY